MNSCQVLSLRKIKTNYGSYHSAFSTLYERLRDPWSGICYSAEAPGSGSLSWWWVASACLASDGLTNCRISPSRLCVLCSYSLPHHGDYNFSIFMKMMLNKKLSPIVVMEVKKAKKKKKKRWHSWTWRSWVRCLMNARGSRTLWHDDLWKYRSVLCSLYFSPPFILKRWFGYWVFRWLNLKLFQDNFPSYLPWKAEHVEEVVLGVLQEDQREGEIDFLRGRRVIRIGWVHDAPYQEKWQDHEGYGFQPH